MTLEPTVRAAGDERAEGQVATGKGARLRICTPHCGLDPETRLGGEMYELEVLRELAGRGIALDILLARHKSCPPGIANGTVHRLPIGRGLRWPVAALVLPRHIRKVWQATRFDILRVHSLRYIGPAALTARAWYGVDVPIVAHHHHLDPDWLNPFIEGRVMRKAERVIVGSEFARLQASEALKVPVEKFAVVPYGVDRALAPGDRPEALARRLGVGGAPVALFLGSLETRKNLFFLLDVWRDVSRSRPDAKLVIAGGGPLRTRLERYAETLGVAASVVFTGQVPAAEKPDHYRLADLLVFPSMLEGFGLVVAEAMSCGLPVMISNRGSLPELVVPDAGGFLAEPTDRDAFVRGIVTLLGDRDLRQRFGVANRERVERRFRWDACAAATARVYEDVLGAWRARRRHG
jgi:glycosyltransferase involved in cell wall biosynthesis